MAQRMLLRHCCARIIGQTLLRPMTTHSIQPRALIRPGQRLRYTRMVYLSGELNLDIPSLTLPSLIMGGDNRPLSFIVRSVRTLAIIGASILRRLHGTVGLAD